MTVFKSKVDPASDSFRKNREEMLELVAEMREVESRAVERSNSRADRFHERGQLLPRERIAHLLDPGAPVLEIQNIAGYDPNVGNLSAAVMMEDEEDPAAIAGALFSDD